MQQAEKFNFNTEFGNLAESSPTAATRPKTRFSAAEMEEIRMAAHAEGMASAQARAAQSCAQALGDCASTLTALFERFESIERQHKSDALELALLTARKIAQKALEIHPEEEIVSLVRECLDKLPHEPRIVITLCDHLKGAVESHLMEMAEERSFTGKIRIESSDDMNGADCTIEWSEGGVEKFPEGLAQTIEELVCSRLDIESPFSDQGDLFCNAKQQSPKEGSPLTETAPTSAAITSQQETP